MPAAAIVPPYEYQGVNIPATSLNEDGSVCINRAKYSSKWVWLSALGRNSSTNTSAQYPLILPAVAGAQDTAVVPVQSPSTNRGDVEIFSLFGTSTGRFAVKPYSQALNFYLSNAAIGNNLIFGTSQFGGRLIQTWYETAPGAMTFYIANRTGALNTIRMNAFGRRFLDEDATQSPEGRRAAFLASRFRPFWLGPDSGDEVSITTLATVDVPMSIPSWGDFEAWHILDDSTSTSGVEPVLDVQLIDGLTGYALMDRAIPWADFVAALSLTVTGTAGRLRASSFEAPDGQISHLFTRSSQVIFRFTSRDAGTVTLRTCFRGVLIGYDAPSGRSPNLSAEIRAELLRRAGPSPFRSLISRGRCA